MTRATTGLDLEDSMLGEVRQSPIGQYLLFHIYEVPREVKLRQKAEWWLPGAV